MNKSALALAGFGFAAGIRVVATIAVSAGMMSGPAQSQSTEGAWTFWGRLDHPMEFYREIVSKSARLAVKDDSAKVEIVRIEPPPPKWVMVATEGPPGQPDACGQVTPTPHGSRLRFIYYFHSDRTVLLTTLKDQAFVDAMAWCGFLPKVSPPPTEDITWGNLKY
jgi:hypothetical protein